MLNSSYKNQAVNDLIKIDNAYGITLKNTIKSMERLYNVRIISKKMLISIDSYIESIANTPRDFNTKIGNIRLNYKSFSNNIDSIKALQTKQINDLRSLYRGEYSALYSIIQTLNPTTNLAIASTISTNSIPMAFNSLSGASNIHNSLSWLSNGLSVSNVIANPKGISLIEVAIGMISVNMSNKEIAQKAELSTRKIKQEKVRIEKINVQVSALASETKTLSSLLSKQFIRSKNTRKKDWTLFTQSELEEIVSMLNSAEVLSKKICQKI